MKFSMTDLNYKQSKLDENDSIKFVDNFGEYYNSKDVERDEQLMADKFIDKNDIVLELGCRFGTVSCLLARKCKKLVSIDPDKKAVETCKKNMKRHDLNFECIWCTVSKNPQSIKNLQNDTDVHGYGNFTENDEKGDIPHYLIKDLEEMFSIKFNTIVADCEGCLEQIFKENDMSKINKIMYETDRETACNYDYISQELKNLGLTIVETVDRGNSLKNVCWKKI